MRPCNGLASILLLILLAGTAGASELTALLDSLAVHHYASRPDRVDSLATPAIAAARAVDDSLALGALLLARGRSLAAFGQARRAEPDLREALSLAAVDGDADARLRSLRWLAVSVGLQGRTTEAGRLYGELEAMAAAASDSVHLGWAWIGRAYEHHRAGRADSSAVLYAAAGGVLARAGIMRGAVWAWNGEGLARRQAGDFAGAAASFQRSLQAARAAGDALNEAMALNYLGRLELYFGDPGRAESMFSRAAAIHHAHRHQREGLLPLIDMATARGLAGRPEAAVALLDSVLVQARDHGLADLEIVATVQLTHVLVELERPGAAASACRTMLARPELPSVMAESELRMALALALAARDSTAAALAVLDAVHVPGANLLGWELAAARGQLLLALDRPAAALVEATSVLDAPPPQGADAMRIPVLTVLGRARLAVGGHDEALAAFDEAVALWEAARSVPEDPAWRERRGAAAGDLFVHAVAARLEHPRHLPLAERQAAAHELLQRYKARTLLERMLGPGRELPALGAPASLPTLRRDALREGDVLLDMVQGIDQAVVFCVTADTVLTAILPGSRDLAPRLRRLEDALMSTAVNDPGPAVRLATAILAGLPPAVRGRLRTARRLRWCPDGSLHRLPLALLAGADGWLTADCEVSRLPAAAMLPGLQARGDGSGDGILAIHGAEPGGIEPLPGAAAETRWLAARLKGVTRISGLEAAAVEGPDWRGAAVLHLATHVDLDPRQPWQAAVHLAPGPGGSWRASEVAGDSVAADLVVLSGCRTAGSDVVGGEGLLGLGAGFLAAGAPAVLATLWDVDDLVAARFVADYYGALADGRTAAGALAVARQACRARPATVAPRHWAGFVLVGDGARTVPVDRGRSLWPVGVVLLGAAVAAYGVGRRRSGV